MPDYILLESKNYEKLIVAKSHKYICFCRGKLDVYTGGRFFTVHWKVSVFANISVAHVACRGRKKAALSSSSIFYLAAPGSWMLGDAAVAVGLLH
jgi:hypothetical protein